MTPSLAALFDGPARHEVRRRTVQGGEALLSPGDGADRLYLVRAGLLAASAPPPGRHLLGLIGTGEPIGEMALLAGVDHANTVTAIRDSVVDELPAAAFLRQAARRPELLAELARLALLRARRVTPPAPPARTVLVASVSPGLDPRPLASALASASRREGRAAIAVDRNSLPDEATIADLEMGEGLVLISARHDEDEWTARCRRQVDRVLLLGSLQAGPPPDCALCGSEPLQQHQLVDLVLTRPPGARVVGGRRWLETSGAARLHHVDAAGGGVARLARVLGGASVGLVLSGGGARAFAHIGVVAALREAGVPIDLVAGTSMGAIVAAGVASGWDAHEMDWRMRRAFVETNPLDDVALPIIAMTRGRKVEHRLAEHFGEGDIADLALPFICVSTDLTAGRHYRHDRGPLARALRASISLPGVLPPVVEDGRVLVDGGVVRNLPTDVMRGLHEGVVVGSDVTRDAGLLPTDLDPPRSWLRWFASGAWRRGPPLVSVLMRSATVAASAEIELARAAADVYVMPDVGSVEIRDWRAYPRAVDAGLAAMRAALATDDGPAARLLTGYGHRRSPDEAIA